MTDNDDDSPLVEPRRVSGRLTAGAAVAIGVGLFAAVGVGSGSDGELEPEPSSQAAPSPTVEETLDAPPPRDVDDEIDELCDAYLTSLRGEVRQLRSVLGPDAPAGVVFALDEIQSAPSPSLAREARASVRGYVRPICDDVFAAGLEPAETDADAARDVATALDAGDLVQVRALLYEDAAQQLEVWLATDSFTAEVTEDDFGAIILGGDLSAAASWRCNVQDGVVALCELVAPADSDD